MTTVVKTVLNVFKNQDTSKAKQYLILGLCLLEGGDEEKKQHIQTCPLFAACLVALEEAVVCSF